VVNILCNTQVSQRPFGFSLCPKHILFTFTVGTRDIWLMTIYKLRIHYYSNRIAFTFADEYYKRFYEYFIFVTSYCFFMSPKLSINAFIMLFSSQSLLYFRVFGSSDDDDSVVSTRQRKTLANLSTCILNDSTYASNDCEKIIFYTYPVQYP